MSLFRHLRPVYRFLTSANKQCQVQLRKGSSAGASSSGPTSTYGYRGLGHIKKSNYIQARVIYICMWLWVWYGIFIDYEHLFGAYTYPNPLDWTDEELGIPPDSEE